MVRLSVLALFAVVVLPVAADIGEAPPDRAECAALNPGFEDADKARLQDCTDIADDHEREKAKLTGSRCVGYCRKNAAKGERPRCLVCCKQHEDAGVAAAFLWDPAAECKPPPPPPPTEPPAPAYSAYVAPIGLFVAGFIMILLALNGHANIAVRAVLAVFGLCLLYASYQTVPPPRK